MDAMRIRKDAREAYTEWLSSHPWDLFVTLTDGDHRRRADDPEAPYRRTKETERVRIAHPETMHKRTRFLFNQINQSLYGSKWWKRTHGIEHVIGIERQGNGSAHSHALVRFPDHDINDPEHFSLRYWQKFATELGGFSWLERPKNSEATTNYVCKYVLKDGEIYLSDGFQPAAPRYYGETLEGAVRLH